MKPEPSQLGRGQVRTAAAVIIATMLLWMGISWLGGQLGWPARWAILIDLSALAAFFWALVVLFQVWRQRRNAGE